MAEAVLADGTSAQIAGKYLTFSLDQEEYGLEILKVREIIGYMNITAVPNAANHVSGVINLRGQVIPVIDLRQCFDMTRINPTEQTCIIVVEIQLGNNPINIGIAVDRVLEVVDVHPDQIQPPPMMGEGYQVESILGLAKIGETVKILLDIDRILTRETNSGISIEDLSE